MSDPNTQREVVTDLLSFIAGGIVIKSVEYPVAKFWRKIDSLRKTWLDINPADHPPD